MTLIFMMYYDFFCCGEKLLILNYNNMSGRFIGFWVAEATTKGVARKGAEASLDLGL
jgi:hypothetical protein